MQISEPHAPLLMDHLQPFQVLLKKYAATVYKRPDKTQNRLWFTRNGRKPFYHALMAFNIAMDERGYPFNSLWIRFYVVVGPFL